MSANRYGVPVEQNDRLLELAGGCRHDFPHKYRDEPCTKCRAKWWAWNQFPSDPDRNPAVGDGHAMDLGEMVRLWVKLRPNDRPTVRLALQANGVWMADAVGEFDAEGIGEAATPEAALAAAIIAAVDGEKA